MLLRKAVVNSTKDLHKEGEGVNRWRAFLAANTARAKARRLELDWSIFSTVAEWSEEEAMSEELR